MAPQTFGHPCPSSMVALGPRGSLLDSSALAIHGRSRPSWPPRHWDILSGVSADIRTSLFVILSSVTLLAMEGLMQRSAGGARAARTSLFVVLFMGFLRKPGVLDRPSWTLQAGPVVRPAASINSSPPGPSAFASPPPDIHGRSRPSWVAP